MARAARRNREHLRRTTLSDITPEQELLMRRRARKCPLCSSWMTGKTGQPNSKHLDHILPINQGGTHTHGNVRIICAACNLRRPKDGSDYTGTLTLWAQGDVPVSRPDRRSGDARKTCRQGLHPWIQANVMIDGRQKRCKLCYEARKHPRGLQRCECGELFAAPGRTFMCSACIMAAGHQAADLHASGMPWDEVAHEVGYTTAEGARYAARRIGYQPGPRGAKGPVAAVLRCSCGGQRKPYARWCDDCTKTAALRAVHLRHDLGWPLWRIAGELGYQSITSVTNLMKTVIRVEVRMGRPPQALKPVTCG